MKLENLTQNGKEELALAILLWKDFKSQGKMDIEIFKQALQFTDMLNIRKEFDDLHSILPPLIIKPR